MGFMYHDDDPIPREEGVGRILPTHDPRIPHDWIEKAAYYRWEKKGRPHGNHWADWLEAEQELHGKAKPAQPPEASSEAPPEGSPKDEPHGHSWIA